MSSAGRSQAYTDAGVNIEAGNALVARIKKSVALTHTSATSGVLSDIGGFGGLFRPDLTGMEDPVLVSATDGVGTKLKLAFAFDTHHTVGIDLVAMSVNDILVQGARPLFFLDYFATGRLDVDTAHTVINGIAEGCRTAGCALLGGETAEMPDMYADGEYDIAGFCVGIVDRAKIIDGSAIQAGHSLIGIAASGLHSNGFSLVRKLLARSGLQGQDIFPGTKNTVREVLLTPTHIYVESILDLVSHNIPIHGMVHITGGGFYDNIPRVLPPEVAARIRFGAWDIPPVFHWLREQGGLDWAAMLQIFNCGIGFILAVPHSATDHVINRIQSLHIPAWHIGTVDERVDNEQVLVENL